VYTEQQPPRQPPPTLDPALAAELTGLATTALTIGLTVAIAHLNRQLKKIGQQGGVRREHRRALDLLAQLAVLSGADRVVLGILHNGAVGLRGMEFHKLHILYAYEAPGVGPLPELGKDVPVQKIAELQNLLASPDGTYNIVAEDAKNGCRQYLSKRGISCIHNKLITLGTVPIGILSKHYCHSDPIPTLDTEQESALISELRQIAKSSY
jgi:hypothetical protein